MKFFYKYDFLQGGDWGMYMLFFVFIVSLSTATYLYSKRDYYQKRDDDYYDSHDEYNKHDLDN